jgi:hypothetical protein
MNFSYNSVSVQKYMNQILDINFHGGQPQPFLKQAKVSVTSPQGSHAQPGIKISVVGKIRQVQSLP